jgi:aspartate/methionine/tyrosine aminotransferase
MSRARRLQPFGETVFTEITRMAADHDAIDLGQGYPNFDGPDFAKLAATRAIEEGHGQYARSSGLIPLVSVLAENWGKRTGLAPDPLTEVTVTSGCTEALAATFLGLFDPGDEVVLIEPTYDAYVVDAALAGAVPRFVTLRPPDFVVDADAVRAAITPRTKAILINTPHNPVGRVYTRDELAGIAALAIEHDLFVISDEVYEHMVYDGEHIPIATLPEMWERTITLSSFGKTFSLTGWKIGWAIAPQDLSDGIRAAHQFIAFASATPLQHGALTALHAGPEYYRALEASYRERRDLLASGLTDVGFDVFVPEGTYFLLADHTPFGFEDDVTFVRHLIQQTGVAAIPPSAFYHHKEDGAAFVRFAFCKDLDTLTSALDRLSALSRP